MKLFVNIARWLVGLLFIFSGLIKANDPHGLAYKMEEFFERWSADGIFPSLMEWLHQFALQFSLIMIPLEIIAGVAIIIGLWKKFFTWLLFALIIFFTILTGYADLSGKIKECGCFGDCIPLSARQSFMKDILLLVLITFLLIGRKYIKPMFSKSVNIGILAAAILFSFSFQWYVMRNLPVVDCLPFAVGNNILELREIPDDVQQAESEYIFIYEKDGKQEEFDVENLPDSTWEFVDRREVVIQEGDDTEPPIKDYELISEAGEDITDQVLNNDQDFYIFYVTNINKTASKWADDFKKLFDFAKQNNREVIVVTADPTAASQFFNSDNNYQVNIFGLDAVAFKTAARTNPELYHMHGPVIQNKWGKVNVLKALKE